MSSENINIYFFTDEERIVINRIPNTVILKHYFIKYGRGTVSSETIRTLEPEGTRDFTKIDIGTKVEINFKKVHIERIARNLKELKSFCN
ncbi:MAG: hypothetical protein ABH804_01705 [archaeon]